MMAVRCAPPGEQASTGRDCPVSGSSRRGSKWTAACTSRRRARQDRVRCLVATAAQARPSREPRPRIAHGAVTRPLTNGPAEPHALLGCYHPSRQNQVHGKLTPVMMGKGIQEGEEADREFCSSTTPSWELRVVSISLPAPPCRLEAGTVRRLRDTAHGGSGSP